MIKCVQLNPVLDVIYTLPECSLGETMVDINTSVYPAGKALNVAKVVRALKEDVAIIGIMPDAGAHRFEAFCDEHEINHHFLKYPGELRVNTTILEKAARQTTHISSKGWPVAEEMAKEFIQFFSKKLAPADMVAFSGSVASGLGDDIYKQCISLCRKQGLSAMLDSRGKALQHGVRAHPTMVKPNLVELEALYGEEIRGVRHIALKGKHLLDRGVDYVFISLGADGMIAIHENDCLLCSMPSFKVVDTVGCGDALVAGLLVGSARKYSFNEMCRLAIACATSNAKQKGPGVIEPSEVWAIMEDVVIEGI